MAKKAGETWRRVEQSEEEIRRITVGELKPHSGTIVIVEYDCRWPELYAREAERIRALLGSRALRIEHVGSTAVSGLAAKPIVDLLVVVKNSADEDRYLPELVAAGYALRIREPDWHEHRMFKGPDTDINLHVFSLGCPEIERMLLFRDWLRNHTADRGLYEGTKLELARKEWTYVQNYADAKTGVVEEIMARVPTVREPESAKAEARGADRDGESGNRRAAHFCLNS